MKYMSKVKKSMMKDILSIIENILKALKDAVIIDGVDLMGYTTWGCIDLLSASILSNVKKDMDLFM